VLEAEKGAGSYNKEDMLGCFMAKARYGGGVREKEPDS
jgi:hypothetical protein